MSRTAQISVGSDGEIICRPVGSVPSDAMLAMIIAETRGNLASHNLYLTIPPAMREEFEKQGWVVAGITTNHSGLGQHAFKMRYRL